MYIDYHKIVHRELKGVYDNIKSHLNVENFGFIKVYKDCSFYYLNSDSQIAHNYISTITESNIFYKESIDSVTFDNQKYYFIIWPKEALSISMNVYFQAGIWNGLSCMCYEEDSVSIWWVATKPENMNIFNLYEQASFRKKFIIAIDYFNKQLLMIPASITRRDYPQFKDYFHFNDLPELSLQDETEHEKILSLIKQFYPKGIAVNTRNGLISLTPKEIEVLNYMSRGYSSKEIANIFGNTSKTIENHRHAIKHRTGCTLRSDLVALYNGKLKFLLE